jgi:hypothetical protein
MDYKEIDKLNQSLLKKILISPKEFLAAQNKYLTGNSEEEHFVFGSVVDIMLTGTQEEFKQKYIKVPDSLKCSDTVKAIVQGVFEEKSLSDFGLEHVSYRDVINKHCKFQNYQANWKDDTKIDKIIKEGSEYFDFLLKGVGKTIITESDYADAVACVIALKQDKWTSIYCNKKAIPKDVEFLDKFVVEFTRQGLDIKGELDRVVIDHGKKTITPIDFKYTGKSIHAFQKDFWQYRYDFQAATYFIGLKETPFIKDLVEKGYVLGHFLYIVVERSLKNNPMIFKVSDDVLTIGLVGGERPNGYLYEGLGQAILRYQYAVENNAWDYPMEYYDNNGYILLEP